MFNVFPAAFVLFQDVINLVLAEALPADLLWQKEALLKAARKSLVGCDESAWPAAAAAACALAVTLGGNFLPGASNNILLNTPCNPLALRLVLLPACVPGFTWPSTIKHLFSWDRECGLGMPWEATSVVISGSFHILLDFHVCGLSQGGKSFALGTSRCWERC
jgi:hypothetical protein